jgi:hypothetical protein
MFSIIGSVVGIIVLLIMMIRPRKYTYMSEAWQAEHPCDDRWRKLPVKNG